MSSPNTRYKLRKTYDQQLKNEVKLKTKENVLRYLRFFNFVQNNIITLYDSNEDLTPDKFSFLPFYSVRENYYKHWDGFTGILDDVPFQTHEWGFQ
jgi:hypothetical protein